LLAYVTLREANKVAKIHTSTNAALAEIPLAPRFGYPSRPYGAAVHPDGNKVYVANSGTASVSVIDTLTNQVIPVPLGVTIAGRPISVALPKDGSRLWIGNQDTNVVAVMNTANNDVNHTIGMPAGCFPYGLTGSNVKLEYPFQARKQLALWVALEGAGCNKVGEFGARYQLGKIWLF
jgi:YVTN family beta-propeller protein